MKPLRAWLARFRGLFRNQRFETDMSDELRSHLEMHAADNIRAGMTADEAWREAVLKLGGVEPVKEAYRDRSTVPFLEHLLLDFRFALRQLRKTPAFAGTAMLVTALGVGATLAIFAFVDAALIKPLPYRDASRLVSVTESGREFGRANLSYLDFRDWQRSNTVFASFDVYSGTGFLFRTASGAEPVPAGAVSGGFFRTLGVRPILGRDFSPGEEERGGARAVMASYAAWQSRFAGRRDLLGQTVVLSGEPLVVIGVLPADFVFAPLPLAEFWTTIDMKSECTRRRSCHNLDGIARLKDGVTPQAALANLLPLTRELARQYPDSNRDRGALVVPFAEFVAQGVRPILLLLMAGAGLLLLIAYVNVSSLVLSRAETRKREVALRSALGASRGRLFSQFVIEGVVLVGGGCVAGVALAGAAMQLLKSLIPTEMLPGMVFLRDLGMSPRVWSAAGLIAVVGIVLLSATPALYLAALKMGNALNEASRGSTGKGWQRLGSRLVVVELAVAMVLLVGAGLLGKSLHRLMHVTLGFRPDHLATIEVAATDLRYRNDPVKVAIARDVERAVEQLPGVQSVALTSQLPVTFNGNTDWIRIVGKPWDGHHIEVNERDVSAGYFQTIGANLLRGRYFTDADDASKPRVVIVNETFARRYLPGEDAVGKQIGDTSLTPRSIATIVGVVEDIRDGALDSEVWPAEYHAFNQDPGQYFIVMARTAQDPGALLTSLRAAIHRLHLDFGLRREWTMEARIQTSTAAYLHRSSAWLVGGFAAIALLLGLVGLYGVIAYSVSQRTREIGVRIALGAERPAVYRMVLGQAGRLAIAGIALGGVGAIGGAVFARALLFAVSPWDVPVLAAVATALLAVSAAASFLPARRAASVNPVDALRAE